MWLKTARGELSNKGAEGLDNKNKTKQNRTPLSPDFIGIHSPLKLKRGASNTYLANLFLSLVKGRWLPAPGGKTEGFARKHKTPLFSHLRLDSFPLLSLRGEQDISEWRVLPENDC
jgi:hypothetical protein